VFATNEQFVKIGEDDEKLVSAPPAPVVLRIQFPVKVLFVISGDDAELQIAPPYVAEFPLNRQLRMVGDEDVLYIPPPLLKA
jgi:hypothetical protein